jgi:hypothetical protein
MISVTHNTGPTSLISQHTLQLHRQKFTISCQFQQLTRRSHIPMSATRQWLVSVIRDMVFVYKD